MIPKPSASTKRQPRKIQRTKPSSSTRLVEANMNASAGTSAAPFLKTVRAVATAAYEHDELTAPRKVAHPTERRLVFPNCLVTLSLRTKTCRKADSPKPNASAQNVCHSMSSAPVRL